MGEVAKSLVSLSGPESVHGIIPEALMAYEQDGRPVGDSASTTTIDASIGTKDDAKDAAKNAAQDAAGDEPSAKHPQTTAYGTTTIVPTMHARKQLMAQSVLSGGPGSGFIALSGGFGTLEEIMEIATWNQLGIHEKGVVFFNVNGYWNGIVSWMNHAIEEGFIREGNRGIIVEAKTAEDAVRELREYKGPAERFNLVWGQS